MPALNIEEQFRRSVLSGKKRCDIQPCRKDGRDPRAGQTLFLFTGRWARGRKSLGQHACRQVRPIAIRANGRVLVGHKPMSAGSRLALFRMHGFDRPADFFAFFETTHGLPFKGILIEW